MTKVVLLYKSRHEGDTFYSPKIHGGIEKFARQLGDVIPDIIPVVVSPEERKKRLTRSIIESALSNHDPDVVISNDIDGLYTNFVSDLGYPVISIIHEPASGDIRFVDLGKRLIKLQEQGGHVYFVSNNQYNFHKKMCERIHGVPLPDPTGFIPSSYCEENLFNPGEILYSAGTIGRTDVTKDPFILHKKLTKSKYSSLVITDNFKGTKKDGANEKYRNANLHWSPPQITLRDLNHNEIMQELSHMGCYVSTCTFESWGITALEALGTGIPLIILTDKTGNHSSEDIPVSEDHFFKIKKSAPKEDLYELIDKANSICNRMQIAEETRKFHTKERWNKLIEDMINRRLDQKMITNSSNIMDFFN